LSRAPNMPCSTAVISPTIAIASRSYGVVPMRA
jgi:hypothetical protein